MNEPIIPSQDPAESLKGSVEMQTLIRDPDTCKGIRAGYDDHKKLLEQIQRDVSRDKSIDCDQRLAKIEAIADILDMTLAFKMRADFLTANKLLKS